MSGKTPGQIAYEGFVASQEPDGFEYETWADKDEHGDSATMGRADWEAAAQAVAAHAASPDADGSVRRQPPAPSFRLITDTSGIRHMVDAGGVRQLTEESPGIWDLAIAAGSWPAIVQFAKGILGAPEADGSGSAAEITRLRGALAEIERLTDWANDNDDDTLSIEHVRDLARNGLKGAPAEPKPAPEPDAATAETRRVLDLLDQATRAVLGKRWALTGSEKRIISGFRRQAGLDVSTRELAYAEDREAEDVADGDAGPEA